jgi:hypothetical protein
MKTFKAATPTTTNYVMNIDGLYYAVRKNSKGYWTCLSYKTELISTDKYHCRIYDGFDTKKAAINQLMVRINEVPKGFYHV